MNSSCNDASSSFSTIQKGPEGEHPSLVMKTIASDAEVDLDVKKSRKILHFCDGALEECDSNEDELDKMSQTQVDPKTLTWGPWMLHQTTVASTKTLQVIDYMGESLASFFGITTPKYQYEIDEYEIMRAEEEEEKKNEDLEMGGWTGSETAVADKSNLPRNGSQTQGKCNAEMIYDGPIKLEPHSLQS